VHFGLILPNYGESLAAERLSSAATSAEEAGFDSGWVTDHVVVPAEHAAVYGTIAEALVSLGFLAARTRRLELGVSALVVPQRNPLVVLRQLATLDLLSGGRIVTAVAAGWMEGEFAVLGADFRRRGRLLDEWLDLAASVFEQMPGRVTYAGDFFKVDGWLAPALVRPGGPELWVAGVSDATLRRAARTGVWHPVALPPSELRPMAAELRRRRPDSRVVLRITVSFATRGRAATSAAAMRSPDLPSGRSNDSRSTSMPGATASSSIWSTTGPGWTTASSSSESASPRPCARPRRLGLARPGPIHLAALL
jgi:alkanesulfonate monooxygenase SsuD/methylene tetrahydromethanopterin reductase-like flavin-dependent oxidoreductase (luciferase family)